MQYIKIQLSCTFTVTLGTSWEVSSLDLDTRLAASLSKILRCTISFNLRHSCRTPAPPEVISSLDSSTHLLLNPACEDKKTWETVDHFRNLDFQQMYMQGKCISFEDIEMHTPLYLDWHPWNLQLSTVSINVQTYIYAKEGYLFRRYWDTHSSYLTDTPALPHCSALIKHLSPKHLVFCF